MDCAFWEVAVIGTVCVGVLLSIVSVPVKVPTDVGTKLTFTRQESMGASGAAVHVLVCDRLRVARNGNVRNYERRIAPVRDADSAGASLPERDIGDDDGASVDAQDRCGRNRRNASDRQAGEGGSVGGDVGRAGCVAERAIGGDHLAAEIGDLLSAYRRLKEEWSSGRSEQRRRIICFGERERKRSQLCEHATGDGVGVSGGKKDNCWWKRRRALQMDCR